MDEWGVIRTVVEIVAFGVLIGAPLLKLNANISRLTAVLDMLQKQFCEEKLNNEKEHNAIWSRSERQDEQLGNHETRITVLEHGRDI